MNQPLNTYKAKGKDIGLVFLFKYDLNGNLKLFEISEGELNDEQIKWLFSSNFPARESIMKSIWMKEAKYKKVFEVEKSAVDLSFDAFWNLYDYKVDKWQASKQFTKLKEADLIRLFLSIPDYKAFIGRKKIDMKYPGTYISQRTFETEFKKL